MASVYFTRRWLPKLPKMYALRTLSTAPDTTGLMTMEQARNLLLDMVGQRKQWIGYGEGKKEKEEVNVMQTIATSQDVLPQRTPQDSYSRVYIPLGSGNELEQERYMTYQKGIRFGRLLEDFDSLAGLICYRHNLHPALGENQKSPLACVTVLVDRIELSKKARQLSLFKDIFMEGKVTWVGNTSIECTMHLEQELNGALERMITAKFMFVAMSPKTGRPTVVNPLVPKTEEDEENIRQGEVNKQIRHMEGKKSLLKTPPTEEERLVIHDLFLSTIDMNSNTLKVRVKPPNTVWMEDTRLKNLIICQPEFRNLYNKIFGGFLMRQAYELAFTSVSLFTKSRPAMCKVVDDILFLKPVEIGSLLFFSSQIVYTKGPDLQIHVHAEVVNPVTGTHETTNNFHFTFDTGIPDLPQVIPKTYAEAMMYLSGKRHYDQ